MRICGYLSQISTTEFAYKKKTPIKIILIHSYMLNMHTMSNTSRGIEPCNGPIVMLFKYIN